MLNLVNEKMNALVLRSRIDLQCLVDSVEITIEYSQYQFTEDSINKLEYALGEAIKVLEASNSDDNAYKAEYDALMSAYNAIVPLTKGDVNFDEEITVKDAIFTLKYVVGTQQFNDREIFAADMREDNAVTVLDAVLLQRAIIGA